jgi:hypothetical protein
MFEEELFINLISNILYDTILTRDIIHELEVTKSVLKKMEGRNRSARRK